MVESSVLMTSHKESRLFPCGPSVHTTLSQWLLLHQSRDESQEYKWRPKLMYIYSYLLLINCQMKFILAHMSALEYGRVRRSPVWVLFNPSSALQWRSPFYACSRPFNTEAFLLHYDPEDNSFSCVVTSAQKGTYYVTL